MPRAETPAPGRATLVARELHVWRGTRHVLQGVSFELAAGGFLKLTGPNGSGKTTLLRVACGLMPAEQGEVLYRGLPVHGAGQCLHEDLAYLGHANALKADLTAAENLHHLVGLRRRVTAAAISAALERAGLVANAGLPARVLSAGQQRRLALARLPLLDARVWALDEPATNLDAAGHALLEALLREHLARDGLVIAAAHQALLDDLPGHRVLELH